MRAYAERAITLSMSNSARLHCRVAGDAESVAVQRREVDLGLGGPGPRPAPDDAHAARARPGLNGTVSVALAVLALASPDVPSASSPAVGCGTWTSTV